MGSTTVRRNLFHHNLSRRPATGAPTTTTIREQSNGLPKIQPGSVKPTLSEGAASSLTTGPVDNGDIVIKDKNGGYKLDIPMLLPLIDSENGDEMEGVDEGGPDGGSGAAGETGINGREKQKIEASLVEMMCRKRRSRQMSNEPAEILNLIRQSLRNRVAALDEDNWMYEAE